jgi:HEAT repeat protein
MRGLSFELRLKHPTPEVRAMSILAFGKVGGPENLAELKPLAQDPNPIVRAAAQMATAALESAAE